MGIEKIVLVTGAAQRVGRAIAEFLAAKGWTVAVHYHRSEKEARELVQLISERGGRAAAFSADLTQEKEVQQLIPQVSQSLGFVQCLINNASAFTYDSCETSTRALWDEHMEVNLRAPFILSQAFSSQFPNEDSDEKKGSIINILDQRVWNLTPHYMSYTVSKVGLWTLTQSLALALAPQIRVNAIGPGPTLPNASQTQEQFLRQCSSLPLKKGPTLQEICDTILYVIQTPSITGQMIALDGGQHLGWSFPSSPNRRDD